MLISKCKPLVHPLKSIHRHVSALYLPGDKAKETLAVLNPHLDFKEKLENKTKLVENIENRKLKLNIEQFYEKWNLYRELEIMKQTLDKKRTEVSDSLKNLAHNDEDTIRKLKIHGKTLRDDLKLLKEKSYDLQDTFIHEFLKLPNKLHKSTPIDNDQQIFVYLDKKESSDSKYHLFYDNFIEYYDETLYYLKNEAAEFDLDLPFHCIDYHLENDFIQFSNPDFVRSVIGEAAGFSTEDLLLISEDNINDENKVNLLHLTGGGSVLGFLGYIAKLSVFSTALPIKLITSGKLYNPVKFQDLGLYAPCQSTVVQGFVITKTQEELDIEFNKLLQQTICYYKKFEHHFRVVYSKADKLTVSESLRASFQMYSPYFKQYIEVGSISCYGNYISKRLLCNVRDGKNMEFPHIVSGTLLNIPKLIAIFLENNKRFEIPEFLKT